MEELIAQIRAAALAGLDYLALMGALSLPDICGALESENGRASGAKYVDWFRKNVPVRAELAREIYGLRCSLLHQGRAHPAGSAFPIAFTFGPGGLHNVSTVINDNRVDWLHVTMFVDEITSGALQWLATYGDTDRVKKNLEKFARYRPEGLPPHTAGFPAIA